MLYIPFKAHMPSVDELYPPEFNSVQSQQRIFIPFTYAFIQSGTLLFHVLNIIQPKPAALQGRMYILPFNKS